MKYYFELIMAITMDRELPANAAKWKRTKERGNTL
jgi:hypothetical protein